LKLLQNGGGGEI